MRHQSSLKSARLQTVLSYLNIRGRTGASSRDLLIDCNINRASDAIYDLRKPGGGGRGVDIVSAWEKSERTGKSRKRYWLARFAPAVATDRLDAFEKRFKKLIGESPVFIGMDMASGPDSTVFSDGAVIQNSGVKE